MESDSSHDEDDTMLDLVHLVDLLEDVFCEYVKSLQRLNIPEVYKSNLAPEVFHSHYVHFATVADKLLADPTCDIEDCDDAIMMIDLVLEIMIANKHYTEDQIHLMFVVRKKTLLNAKQKFKTFPIKFGPHEHFEWSLQLRNLRARFREQTKKHIKQFDEVGRKIPQ